MIPSLDQIDFMGLENWEEYMGLSWQEVPSRNKLFPTKKQARTQCPEHYVLEVFEVVGCWGWQAKQKVNSKNPFTGGLNLASCVEATKSAEIWAWNLMSRNQRMVKKAEWVFKAEDPVDPNAPIRCYKLTFLNRNLVVATTREIMDIMEEASPGEVFSIQVVMMTREAFEAIPEFDGF
jgi:hypothetical protein